MLWWLELAYAVINNLYTLPSFSFYLFGSIYIDSTDKGANNFCIKFLNVCILMNLIKEYINVGRPFLYLQNLCL